MADTIFSYENVKNNKEIRDQWRKYILQKFSNKPRWPLLTQILGDSNTLQIDKLTPESFNTINKILGASAIYDDRPIDTIPLRPPLMQKSAQQIPDNNNDAIPNNQKKSVEPSPEHFGDGSFGAPTYGPGQGHRFNPEDPTSPEHFGDGSFGQGHTSKSAKVAVDISKSQKSGTISAKSGNIDTSSIKVIGGSGRSTGGSYATSGQPTGGTYSTPKPTPMYDPSIRLNNNVQYVINTLKTYGYPQQVLDSFKQNIDKILANTKDNNRIDTANQYIDQFLGDKQDLRRLDPAPGKPAPNQQPQKAGNTAGGTQGVVTVGGTQGTQGVQGAQTGGTSGTQGSNNGSGGAQAGVKTGNAVVGGGVQGSNNKPGKKPRMSDAEINAFLNEELGGDTTGNGTYASANVPKGGTKTIGYDPYDPNPGNVSLAYAMRNAPEQERRTALINEWNQEHGISYVTGKDGLIYRIDPQHPNGYVDPFKNDLSKIGSTGYATGEGMLTSGSNGTYATGEGIKDANGNVLTNPGGDWEYQYALRDPQYGLGMMGKMSDAQKKYLQAVADDMGYKYNFTGATRFV